ncbi:BlaI/MecI/CopY family transcriptional regulator [Aerococcaceae bacterium WGS1372]
MKTESLPKEKQILDINISESEWEVMRVLWAEAPLTSREIIDRVLQVVDWKEGTVKSLINRLTSKAQIRKIKTDTVLRYEPTLKENYANTIKLDRTMSVVCTKERGNLISHLIENNDISKKDIKALIKQLNEKLVDAPDVVECRCLLGQCHCHLH